MGKGGSDIVINKSWVGDDTTSQKSQAGNDTKGSSVGLSCANLKGITVLSAPEEDVVASLQVGDLLKVEEQDGYIIARTQDGKKAGTLLTPIHGRLILCIKQGYEYQAEVLGVDGIMCKVRIFCSRVKQ